jgi:branched-chain amino acid transport system ATP-binding protein
MTAVLGANGAGKSTVLMTLAGLLPRISGEITFDGRPLPTEKPHRLPALGISFVPDDRALFTTLTTKENLELAYGSNKELVDEVLTNFPALVPRLGISAGMLSGGEQQMLALARALISRPRLLLIDELSLGLAPVIAEELLYVVRRLADQHGTAVIFVEQHVHMALKVADRGIVMSHGELVLSGSPAELLKDRGALESSYLGQGEAADHERIQP